MFLSYNHFVHAHHQIGDKLALLFYPDVELADVNRFCHNTILFLLYIPLVGLPVYLRQQVLQKALAAQNRTQK